MRVQFGSTTEENSLISDTPLDIERRCQTVSERIEACIRSGHSSLSTSQMRVFMERAPSSIKMPIKSAVMDFAMECVRHHVAVLYPGADASQMMAPFRKTSTLCTAALFSASMRCSISARYEEEIPCASGVERGRELCGVRAEKGAVFCGKRKHRTQIVRRFRGD